MGYKYSHSFTLCMHAWIGGKIRVQRVEKNLKLNLFCAFPLALCVCCGDLEYCSGVGSNHVLLVLNLNYEY